MKYRLYYIWTCKWEKIIALEDLVDILWKYLNTEWALQEASLMFHWNWKRSEEIFFKNAFVWCFQKPFFLILFAQEEVQFVDGNDHSFEHFQVYLWSYVLKLLSSFAMLLALKTLSHA